MKKINSLITFVFILLFLTPLVLAGNYGEGIYGSGNYIGISTPSLYCGDGICNNGETCSSCSADCGPCPVSPGGGSSGGGGCTYDWQCTNWFPSICPESGIQERICMNKGTCKGTEGMPNQTQVCKYLGPSEPLFDIYLSLEEKYKKMCSGDKIKANIKLENYAKVELLDAFMTYWIIDGNNKLIAEYRDTRAVEKETSFNIELKIPDSAPEGTYRLYAEITYSGNKTAVAGETFEILSEEECASFHIGDFNWMYLIYAGIGLLGLVFILVVIWIIKKISKIRKPKGRKHSEYKKKIKENLKRIKGRHYLLAIFCFVLLSALFISGNKLTGFAVGSASAISNNWNIFGFILIIGAFGLLVFAYRKKIVEEWESRRINKHSKNSIKGLINKKVYLENGDYIGKVNEVLIEENKIDSLRIKLDKKQKSKLKGIIVKYKDVKCVGHIVIINEKVLEKLNI